MTRVDPPYHNPVSFINCGYHYQFYQRSLVVATSSSLTLPQVTSNVVAQTSGAHPESEVVVVVWVLDVDQGQRLVGGSPFVHSDPPLVDAEPGRHIVLVAHFHRHGSRTCPREELVSRRRGPLWSTTHTSSLNFSI